MSYHSDRKKLIDESQANLNKWFGKRTMWNSIFLAVCFCLAGFLISKLYQKWYPEPHEDIPAAFFGSMNPSDSEGLIEKEDLQEFLYQDGDISPGKTEEIFSHELEQAMNEIKARHDIHNTTTANTASNGKDL